MKYSKIDVNLSQFDSKINGIPWQVELPYIVHQIESFRGWTYDLLDIVGQCFRQKEWPESEE
jgi:hypothetical protein